MNNSEVKVENYRGYKITIWNDADFSESPCTAYDLAGTHLFGYADYRIKSLSRKSHAGALGVNTMFEGIVYLIDQYVSPNTLFNYYKKHHSTFRIQYNKHSRMWELQGLWNDYYKESELTPKEIKDGITFDFMYYFRNHESEELKEDLLDILKDVEDLFIHEDTLTGYCQGDYIKTLSFITKDEFMHRVMGDIKDWKAKSEKVIKDELEEVECWVFGDVYGYTIEDPDGVEVESSGGYYTKDIDFIIDECCGIINSIIRHHDNNLSLPRGTAGGCQKHQ